MDTNTKPCIVLVGANPNTGNLGVNALVWSSIKVIRSRWPTAEIVLVGTGRYPGHAEIGLRENRELIPTHPVRYCRNLFAANHIVKVWAVILLCRLLPFLKRYFAKQPTSAGTLLRCDLIADITGGDSFSDIYGMQRLLWGVLLKRICQLTGKPFVLLPQTYGPFQRPLARRLARTIFRHTTALYSRDPDGLEEIRWLMGKRTLRTVPQFCPDVAFVLDVVRPEGEQVQQMEALKRDGRSLIGLNISGLLYNGGYTQNNMFGLACDYRELVKKLLAYFTQKPDTMVLLVPHVLSQAYALENDYKASCDVWESLPDPVRKNSIVLEERYDQNEIKYLIGLCDFFMGARMHSTIAALSQCIPAVGMAYSKKFAGVFKTADVEDCVVDMRHLTEAQVLQKTEEIYQQREIYRGRLSQKIPAIRQRVNELFNHLDIR